MGANANSPGMNDIEIALRTGHGLLSTAQHRPLRHQIARALQQGKLVRILPGVVTTPDLADDPGIRAQAAMRWQPNAVLMGDAAARLSFLPDHPIDRLEMTGQRPGTIPPGMVFHNIPVPAELRHCTDAGMLTVPELTVLDLAVADKWRPLCEALRRHVVTAESIHLANEAVHPREGLATRAEIVAKAAGNPWSVAELDLQILYRENGITGWVGNQRMRLGQTTVVPDLTFEEARVICQVDSWEFHSSREAFEADRDWHNTLTSMGWGILHITPRQIWQQPRRVLAWTRGLLQGEPAPHGPEFLAESPDRWH